MATLDDDEHTYPGLLVFRPSRGCALNLGETLVFRVSKNKLASAQAYNIADRDKYASWFQ